MHMYIYIDRKIDKSVNTHINVCTQVCGIYIYVSI